MKAIKGVLFSLLFSVLFFANSMGQTTSSKGTEFWTCYMDHIAGASTTGSQMILYITSDVATSGTVSFSDGTPTIPYTVIPNTVTFVTIPASQFLPNEGLYKKGIHIVALKPIAVYAHIYASAVSGATLLLPVNTLGKNYISLNYTQLSNSGTTNPSYSTFAIIATEDNTQVEITPSAKLASGNLANVPFTKNLNKGEVYQALSTLDLTGTKIRSVSTNGPCKKIAVFSGSSKIGIGCNNITADANSQSLSSDNLFQQVYPTSAWGKNYITVPLKSRNYDVYRIVLSDPNTIVKLNGNTLANASFTNGLYYEFNTAGALSTNVISADKPIQVVQYTATQNQNKCSPTSTLAEAAGDPEMIYLSPIEQGLDRVTLYSTGYYNILSSFINIVIPTSAVSTFTVDGVSFSSSFKTVNGNPDYSYAQISVTSGPKSPLTTGTAAGTHNIAASLPFNAIAYGFGQAESYGYAAGTNLVNLNENISLQSTAGTAVTKTTAACVNAIYKLSMTLPYITTNIKWDLKNGSAPTTDAAPVIKSTTVKDGQTLYTYEYAGTVSYATPGDYSVVATVFNPVDDDCGSNKDIQFDFNVADIPVPAFTKTDVCLGAEITFTDKTDAKGSTIKSWFWDFGDGKTSTTANPKHIYQTAGNFPVTLTVVNENGCSATTPVQTVHIALLPVPDFDLSKIDCARQDILFTDKSAPGEGTIVKWVWDFGDGTTIVTKTDNTPFSHAFAIAKSYDVKLTLTTDLGCSNTIIKTIIVNPNPQVNFTLPTVCLINSIAQFTDATPAIAGKTFTYLWDFNDINATPANLNTSTSAAPTHKFTAAGTYKISLTVTSNDGCAVTVIKDYIVTGLAKFTAAATACPNDPVVFTDQTDPSKTAAIAWHWDFDENGATSNLQNPSHAFTVAGDHNVTLTVTGNNGCSVTTYSQKIHITPSPIAGFSFPSSPLCEQKSIIFTDASTSAESPIATWIWDFGDGTPPETYTSKNPMAHTFKNAGTFTVTLKVVTVSGCVSVVLAKQITINPLPTVDFILPDACLDDLVKFYDRSTIADHTEAEFTYLWNFGDPNATAANPNTSTAKDPQHDYSAAGIYKVSLTVKSKYGCEVVSAQRDFIVNGAAPTANFSTVGGASTFCSSDDVMIRNDSHVSFGRITQVKMFWDWAGDRNNFTIYTGTDAIEGAIFKHNYGLNNTPGQSKTYQLLLMSYSGSSQSCTAVSSVQSITVQPNPLITVIAPAALCHEQSPITIQTNNNGFVGTGTFSGPGVTANGVFDPAKTGPGTFTLTYTFIANNTCGYTTSVPVTVNPTPMVNAGANLTLLEGGYLPLSGATASPLPLTYKWTLANGSKAVGLDHDDVLNPVASPVFNTTYMLTVTSVNGCSASSTVTVNVLKLPVVPNTFTPNGDGINDKWEIKYLEQYQGATVEIYDRNGGQIFFTNGYSVPWDGTYKGAPLPTGTYYYIINPKHGRKAISGSITIIK